MKVLHINSYYSNGKFYRNLFDKQSANGFEIDVYVPVTKDFDDSEINLGHYSTISKNHSKYDRFFFHIKQNKIYKDVIKKYKVNNYNILHAHSLFTNGCVAWRLKKEFGVPYIVAVRSTDVNVFLKNMVYLRKLGMKILKEAKKIVFLSETYRDLVIDKYIPVSLKESVYSKSNVIPNGIDDYWFRNKGSKKVYSGSNNLKIAQVGIINKRKNQITTVKAIEILQKKGYNIEFTIVGKIDDESIYDRIKNLPFIRYISPKPKEELIDIYRDNDIFVMPSIHETFGLVYSEAMSQGLPVIYSRGQGFDSQFNEGLVGYNVDCFNPEEIADKIVKILSDYDFLSSNCIELCNKFNWENIANEYAFLYSDKK
ncbi:glycosyltransferase family 4 protein [Virgibacillus senegalensis]|uniref:glycosyltransferase family 4 protein n=1 Tax=Virgibacillus senegalensis TaxID=1499679 RepID=UPI00069F3C2A|nr:glycosyltransferase family 4 protein [Virgibacillus senegalensis]